MKTFFFFILIVHNFLFSEQNLSTLCSQPVHEITVCNKVKSLDFAKTYPNLKAIIFHGGMVPSDLIEDRNYFAKQTTDLGLSNNKNLDSIFALYVNLDGLLKNSNLPKVKKLVLCPPYGFCDLSQLRATPNIVSFQWGGSNFSERDWNEIINNTKDVKEIYFSSEYYGLSKRDLVFLPLLKNLKILKIKLYCASSDYVDNLKMILTSTIPGVLIDIDNYIDPDFEGYWDYSLPI